MDTEYEEQVIIKKRENEFWEKKYKPFILDFFKPENAHLKYNILELIDECLEFIQLIGEPVTEKTVLKAGDIIYFSVLISNNIEKNRININPNPYLGKTNLINMDPNPYVQIKTNIIDMVQIMIINVQILTKLVKPLCGIYDDINEYGVEFLSGIISDIFKFIAITTRCTLLFIAEKNMENLKKVHTHNSS